MMAASFKVDWREVFAGEIRSVQAAYPQAHQALKNWGRWSRELHDIPGLTNDLKAPGLYEGADRKNWEFAQDGETGIDTPEAIAKRCAADKRVKRERADDLKADDKLGHELDLLIHDYQNFAAIWRVVLKAAYCSREIPEYQFPNEAKLRHEPFLTFLDGALAHLQKVLDNAVGEGENIGVGALSPKET